MSSNVRNTSHLGHGQCSVFAPHCYNQRRSWASWRQENARRAPRRIQRPSCWPSSLHRFWDAFFVRFWLHFASQLGPQNPPKSIKNRCSTRLPFCFCFLIVFWSVFAPKLAPRKPKNHQKTIGFIVFFAKSAFLS